MTKSDRIRTAVKCGFPSHYYDIPNTSNRTKLECLHCHKTRGSLFEHLGIVLIVLHFYIIRRYFQHAHFISIV